MLIGWINRADSALLSASSELATLPGSNVQQAHVSRAWHTAAGVKSAYLLLDMGSALDCRLLALLGTNLTAAAEIRVRASDADPTATSSLLLDSGTLPATAKAGYGQSYHDLAGATARYWRIDIEDTTVEDNLQIGRVFLGPRWKPSSNQEYGWQVTPLDPSEVIESWGGQEYADERPQRRQLQFTLNWMDEAEMYGNAFAMARAAGVVRDVVAVHDSLGGGTYLNEQSVFGKLQASEPLVHQNARIFRQKFTVKEAL
jgi:hypothetical protein